MFSASADYLQTPEGKPVAQLELFSRDGNGIGQWREKCEYTYDQQRKSAQIDERVLVVGQYFVAVNVVEHQRQIDHGKQQWHQIVIEVHDPFDLQHGDHVGQIKRGEGANPVEEFGVLGFLTVNKTADDQPAGKHYASQRREPHNRVADQIGVIGFYHAVGVGVFAPAITDSFCAQRPAHDMAAVFTGFAHVQTRY